MKPSELEWDERLKLLCFFFLARRTGRLIGELVKDAKRGDSYMEAYDFFSVDIIEKALNAYYDPSYLVAFGKNLDGKVFPPEAIDSSPYGVAWRTAHGLPPDRPVFVLFQRRNRYLGF